MRIAGFLLLVAGWLIALSSLVLLPGGPARNAFALAGTGVQLGGLFLVFRTHRPHRGAPQ